MIFWVAAAIAASISISSEVPIGVRVDGEVINAGATEVVIDGLSAGRHVVEALNLSGNMIDAYEVELKREEEVLELLFVNRRLQRVLDAGDPNVLMDSGPQAVDEAIFADLLRKLVKGSAKKKFKRLDPYITKYWFNIRQVKVIAASWEKMGDRAAAARLLAPKTVDPENAAAMDALFPSIALRAEVHAAFGIP